MLSNVNVNKLAPEVQDSLYFSKPQNQYMLNQRSQPTLSLLLASVLVSWLVLYTTCQQAMDVIIQNSPDFYYGHRCDLTFSVVSPDFSADSPYMTELFMLTLMQKNNGARFLEYFSAPYIHLQSGKVVLPGTVDICGRGIPNPNFYCAAVPTISSQYSSPVRIQYNSSHFMYKFTTPFVCPTVAVNANSYHIRVRVDVPESSSSPKFKMSANYTFRFVNLRYRVIEQILINPAYTGDTKVALAKNFLVGGQSRISFVFDIVNKTEVNNWQKLEIFFTQPLSSVSINTSTCLFSSSALVPQSITSMSTPTALNYTCSYSSLSNSLVFTNPNYIASQFMENQAFNIYDMYLPVNPGVRFNFSLMINFMIEGSLSFYYQVGATTSFRINDNGTKVSVGNMQVLLYDTSVSAETIYGLNLQNYQAIDARYRAYSPIYSASASAATVIVPTPTPIPIISTNTSPSGSSSSQPPSSSTSVVIYPTPTPTPIAPSNSTPQNSSIVVNTNTSSSSSSSSASASNASSSASASSAISSPTINLSSNCLISTACIFLCVVAAAALRKQPFQFQKYAYVIMILTDLLIKVILIGIVNALSNAGQQNEVSFIIAGFIVIQYVGVGLLLFFNYIAYILVGRADSRTKQKDEKKKSGKQLLKTNIFLIMALLLNYKLYCICFFDLHMPKLPKLSLNKDKKKKQIKSQNKDSNNDNSPAQQNPPISAVIPPNQLSIYRNEHLLIKYCWHLSLQILFILVQVFCVFQACIYLPISLLFAIQQGALAVLMAVVGKYVYRMVGRNVGRQKIGKIIADGKRKDKGKDKSKGKKAKSQMKQIQEMDKQNKQYFSQINRQLEIQSRKSGVASVLNAQAYTDRLFFA